MGTIQNNVSKYPGLISHAEGEGTPTEIMWHYATILEAFYHSWDAWFVSAAIKLISAKASVQFLYQMLFIPASHRMNLFSPHFLKNILQLPSWEWDIQLSAGFPIDVAFGKVQGAQQTILFLSPLSSSFFHSSLPSPTLPFSLPILFPSLFP